MKLLKTAAPLAGAAALALLAAACSSDLKDSDYPETALKTLPQAPAATEALNESAYKSILWSDSIAKVEAMFKDKHPWTGDPFGVYAKDQIVNGVILDTYRKTAVRKPGEEPSYDKDLEEAKKLLPKAERENFIIKQIAFQAGKSDVVVYWFELNDCKRPSRFVDVITWSKMCMVRIIHYDPPVEFAKVLEGEKARYGEPVVRDFKDSDVWSWYKKQVEPRASYCPVKEYLWRKQGLTVAAYDWRKPDEQSGKNELVIRNDAVFKEFEDLVSKRVESLKQDKEVKTEESAKQALAR